ncbi:MAG: HNH endonuclease, partial [Gammaproteobacteria bacterium]|nr:HNH endonuclease [Gammaproteobacteria bacterium]
DGDGMYVVKGRLEPEVGAVLMRAVEAASDALFRREEGAGSGSHEGDAQDAAGSGRGVSCEAGDARPEPKQRRADAVGLLAERALAAGFGGSECRASADDVDEVGGDLDELDGVQTTESDAALRGVPVATPSAEAKNAVNAPSRVGSGTRAERYQVMVHCDAATLAAEGEPGRSDLDGIRVSAETSRRMACDAAVVAMVHAKDASVVSVGRRTRTIPPHIRRALEERDRGCRFPGCGCTFTEAHHVKHWADGGETSLRNTLLLCRRHHRAVHEGRVKVSVNGDGTVLFFTPKGRMLVDAPSRPKAPRDGERPGLPPVPTVHPGAPAPGDRITLSNGAALYHDSEVPWEIEAAAREALDESLETDPRKRE